MPGTLSEAPTVSLSFANNFWGKEDAGVSPLLERMQNAKTTSEELKAFYTARTAIEEEYARKLLNLARKPLGASESGTLRMSLDVVRAEIEGVGKAHQNVAQQMKTELDEQLAAFAGAMKERRKIVQGGIEKLLKVKTQQTISVNKARDRYEQDCLKIKGYLAQGHMVMGQEERKNKAKLERTQIQLSSTNNDYETAVQVLEETTVRWNREWKAACDKFQDLEEERIDFTKSSLWSFANISSTVCVSDDASCEKIRLSLEDCDVEKDIASFIKESGTGQEIPDPPRYVNFRRGEGDAASEMSEDDAYSVAQFQRTINPAYRTSSPQPSTFESHHDSEADPKNGFMPPVERSDLSSQATPKKAPTTQQQRSEHSSRPASRHQDGHELTHREGYPEVPHNDFPMDGMTQFCRLDATSEISSAASAVRPSSRDSVSEYSNPTSFSSVGGSALSQSPTKQMSELSMQSEPTSGLMKKRSGFFQNRSPFRRKSKSEKESPGKGATATNRNTWGSSSVAAASRPHYGQGASELGHTNRRVSPSPEPVDPRANFQLNVGVNVFDVASPDTRGQSLNKQQYDADDADPVARALAELKGVTKQSSFRQSADRYAGLSTPAPGAGSMRPTPQQRPADRSGPPPSYDGTISRLGAPQPAFTSKQMQQTTRQYTEQKQNMFNSAARQSAYDSSSSSSQQQPSQRTTPQSRPGTQGNPSAVPVSRATSPSPSPYRSTSPRPGMYHEQGQAFGPSRATSPNPAYAAQNQQQSRPRAHSTSPTKQQGAQAMPYRGSHPGGVYSSHDSSPSYHGQMPISRSASPQPGGMQMAIAPQSVQQGGYSSSQRPRDMGSQLQARPMSMYVGGAGEAPTRGPGEVNRTRSRSQAPANDRRQMSRDGRPVLHFSRAMYNYTAQIPEELQFNKGDVLAVLRHQDDGWWEAELVGNRARPGLVPSNYLQTA